MQKNLSESSKEPPFSILLLAAGSSTRMGQSKQLLKWDEGTLLGHAVSIALSANPYALVVVLGANEAAHRQVLSNRPVAVVSNPQWESGMGSSIKTGLAYMQKNIPEMGVMIMVCDQPFLTSNHLCNLVRQAAQSGKKILATKYAGILGVPVFFASEALPLLQEIEDKEGARKIVNANPQLTDFVAFEEGKIDLDTPDDYAKFVTTKKNTHE